MAGNEIRDDVQTVSIAPKLIELGATPRFVNEALAAVYFARGALSGKEACELLGMSRREFEEDLLPKFGYTALRHNPRNLDIERRAAARP